MGIDPAAHYAACAERWRSYAASETDKELREKMLEIARGYEFLRLRALERVNQRSKTS